MLKRYRKIKKTSLHSTISFHILTSKYKNTKAFKRFCGNNIDFLMKSHILNIQIGIFAERLDCPVKTIV